MWRVHILKIYFDTLFQGVNINGKPEIIQDFARAIDGSLSA